MALALGLFLTMAEILVLGLFPIPILSWLAFMVQALTLTLFPVVTPILPPMQKYGTVTKGSYTPRASATRGIGKLHLGSNQRMSLYDEID